MCGEAEESGGAVVIVTSRARAAAVVRVVVRPFLVVVFLDARVFLVELAVTVLLLADALRGMFQEVFST